MRKYLVGAALVLIALHARADDFATCLLNNAGATVTDGALAACRVEHPSGYANVIKGSGNSFRDSKSCIQSKTKPGMSTESSTVVNQACQCLYSTSEFTDENCSSDFERKGIRPLEGVRPGQSKSNQG